MLAVYYLLACLVLIVVFPHRWLAVALSGGLLASEWHVVEEAQHFDSRLVLLYFPLVVECLMVGMALIALADGCRLLIGPEFGETRHDFNLRRVREREAKARPRTARSA